ncbi:MAG: peptidylprolyl isomerase [Pirellulaceae bacterium]|nr:peptidylprolyl isomerase [Planctomycetales bacterium]
MNEYAQLKRLSDALVTVRCFCTKSTVGWSTTAVDTTVLLAVILVTATYLALAHAAAAEDYPIVATVDGQPIFRSQLNRAWERSGGLQREKLRRDVADGEVSAEEYARRREVDQARILSALVARELALSALTRNGWGVSQETVELELSRFEKRLGEKEMTIEEFCQQAKMDLGALRREIAWQLGWNSYLSAKITDENLQKLFAARPRDFDGTRMNVSQILIAVDSSDGDSKDGDSKDGDSNDMVQQRWAAARKKCEQLRADIVSDRLEFAEAARRFSSGGSSQDGGRIGWIERKRPMPAVFNDAAFKLQQGEISEPVRGALGMHLIKCLEVAPGRRTWREAQGELEQWAIRRLWQRLVELGEQSCEIHYADDVDRTLMIIRGQKQSMATSEVGPTVIAEPLD